MKQLEQYREKKQPLLDDMLRFITFDKNYEQDIMDMMSAYLKAEQHERPRILENLMQCVRGEDYPDPRLDSYPYTKEDVAECGRILDGYIDRLIVYRQNIGEISRCMEQVTKGINVLHERTGQHLVDTWRREQLCAFIEGAAKAAGLESPEQQDGMTFQWRMW